MRLGAHGEEPKLTLRPAWHFITGEYPPVLGGVADYTRAVAAGLARAGDEVHVWSPTAATGPLAADPGVLVHELPHAYSPRGLRELARRLDQTSRPRRLFVQYVPQAFGFKGLNVPFSAWVAERAQRDELWVMLHEVATPWGLRYSFRQSVHGALTRVMVALLVRSARRLFASTESNNRLLRAFYPGAQYAQALPVPSNVPSNVLPEARARVRRSLGVGDAALIGHFGTFASYIAKPLEGALDRLLGTDPTRHAVLLGRGSDAFYERVVAPKPWAARVHALGALPLDEVAERLSACDLVVQPFPDGISTRRTSAMASLALGVPVVSNRGLMSEPTWAASAGIALAPDTSGESLAAAAEVLLGDSAARKAIGLRGRQLYESEFSLEHTLRVLRPEVGSS